MKYKPCCDRRCLLGCCEIREAGGCYCVCRLKDHECSLERALEGTVSIKNDSFIYIPGKYIALDEDEKKDVLEKLKKVREKLKEYEIE